MDGLRPFIGDHTLPKEQRRLIEKHEIFFYLVRTWYWRRVRMQDMEATQDRTLRRAAHLSSCGSALFGVGFTYLCSFRCSPKWRRVRAQDMEATRDRGFRGAAHLSLIKFNRAKDTNNPEILRRYQALANPPIGAGYLSMYLNIGS